MAEGAESSQQQQSSEAPSTTTTTTTTTEIDDAGLSMPQFDEVMAEQPTVVAETEPSAAQDMPDVGAVDQVGSIEIFSKLNFFYYLLVLPAQGDTSRRFKVSNLPLTCKQKFRFRMRPHVLKRNFCFDVNRGVY